jgi:hypothetical protein
MWLMHAPLQYPFLFIRFGFMVIFLCNSYLPPKTLPPTVLPFDPTSSIPLGVITNDNPHPDEASAKDVKHLKVRNFLAPIPGSAQPIVIGEKDGENQR